MKLYGTSTQKTSCVFYSDGEKLPHKDKGDFLNCLMISNLRSMTTQDQQGIFPALILSCEYPFESDINNCSRENCLMGHSGFITSNDENTP
jgi:hypothetical protein